MRESTLRLFTDLSMACDGGMPELSFDFVYFPQDLSDKIISNFKIKSCEVCDKPIDKNNLRAIIPKGERYIAVCKEIKCFSTYSTVEGE